MPDFNPQKELVPREYGATDADDEKFKIIGSEDSSAMLKDNPFPSVQDIANNTRYGYVPRDDAPERILQYPLDLGEDATHYMVFHIYETTSQTLTTDENKIEAMGGEYEAQYDYYLEGLKQRDILESQLLYQQKHGGGGPSEASVEEIEGRNAMSLAELERIDRKFHQGMSANYNIDKQARAKAGLGSNTRINQPEYPSKDSIILYMPQKINSMNMVDYELGDFALAQGIKGALKDGYGSGFWSKMEGLLGPASNIILNKMVGEFAGAVGIGNPFDVVKLIGRVAINPQKEMVFNAPAPRKYEFAFEFASRSEEEAVMVRNIVQLFKFHAFPRTENLFSGDEEVDVSGQLPTKGMTWYRTPSEFQFEYLHIDKRDGHEIVTENHFLNRAERCVLTEVNVDYSGAGAFQSFEDGAPTHITLTLTFSEARLITQEHIALGY